MYIKHLNGCEKQTLMDLLMHIAICDNKYPPKEESYISGVRRKYDLKIKFKPELTVKQLCSQINSAQSKLIILQELMRAARVDDDLHEKEKLIIEEASEIFDVEYGKLRELEKWVEEGMDWLKSGERIIDL